MVCPELFAIRKNSSMTSTKGCGLIITSWRPMSFKRFKLIIAVGCIWSVAAVICFGQSNNSTASAPSDRIEAGDRKAALEIIGRNAGVNDAQPDGTTPLHWAVYRVDQELVKVLLGRGAKADIANTYGSSPLAE